MENFSGLRAKLDTARDEYHQALKADGEAMKDCGHLPQPDGSLRLHLTGERLRSALARYTEALEALTDYVLKRG